MKEKLHPLHKTNPFKIVSDVQTKSLRPFNVNRSPTYKNEEERKKQIMSVEMFQKTRFAPKSASLSKFKVIQSTVLYQEIIKIRCLNSRCFCQVLEHLNVYIHIFFTSAGCVCCCCVAWFVRLFFFFFHLLLITRVLSVCFFSTFS